MPRVREQSVWVPLVHPPLRIEANLKRTRSMQKPFPGDCLPRLREQVVKSRTKWQLQRALCLLLRASLPLPSWQIAELIGWNTESVRRLHWQYLHYRDAVFDSPDRGGRRNSLLSFQQEYILLRELRRDIWPNASIDVARVRKAYEAAVNHPVSPSTIYRMLARHGWRRIPLVKGPSTKLYNTACFTKRLSHDEWQSANASRQLSFDFKPLRVTPRAWRLP